MSDSTNIFYSNQVECLFSHLKQNLFSKKTPFAKRLIVVPSPAMKSWIMLQMAKDPDLGIATGLEISYLNDSINKLCENTGSKTHTLNHLELAIACEIEIRKIIAASPSSKLWQPLFQYLKIDRTDALSRKTERRLTSLCDTLATQFIQYGLYGGQMVAEWMDQPTGWQQQLWKLIYETSQWTYPHQNLTAIIDAPAVQFERKDVQVHLFALSYLPALHHRFLMRLSKEIPVNLYVLSPCQAFWSDLLTEREGHRLRTYWQKQGANEAQQLALDEYLRDCNPLLANFGKLGREMARQIEESEAKTHESYRCPQSALEHPSYADLLTEDLATYGSNNQLSLLEAIQTDLLVLRNPHQTEKVPISAKDESIQVYVATTRMREVQILYDTLLNLIDKHAKDKPIHPGDIVVMAPNINDYAPFIKAVFESPDSLLEAQIMDLAVPAQSPFVQVFLHLLDLPLSRWDASALLHLLEHQDFQRCHSLTGEDVLCIRDWIKSSGVRWGADLDHRNELLRRDSCHNGMVEETSHGTWEHSIERLVTSLAIHDTAQGHMDALNGPLLGKWSYLLHSLRADLAPLHNGTHMALGEWVHYLRCLRDTYLKTEDRHAFDALESQLEALSKAGQKVSSTPVPFTTIYHHLQNGMNQPDFCHREHLLHAVRFCSLLPMRAIPAQVIAMIGMEEDAYPRRDANSSLNLLVGNAKSDYCPAQIDYDRFLFLETLLSARRYLLITYQGYSAADGKEQSPSILVSELLGYIDKAFDYPSKCLHRHPHLPFDSSYFELDSAFRSYSNANYSAALAYYHVDKTPPAAFVPSFSISASLTMPDSSKPIYINLKDLANFARNPIKTYLNKTLGIYLDKIERRTIKNEEEFHLSRLQASSVKKQALTKSIDEILAQAEREGTLPIGAFKPVAVEDIRNDIELLKHNLRQHGIQSDQISAINLSEHQQQPMQFANGHWHVPPLEIELNGQLFRIVGTLSDASSQGLIAHCKDDKSDVIKTWPQYLAFHSLVQKHDLPMNPRLVMAKGEKIKVKTPFTDHPQQLLAHFLKYYLTSQQNISPLVPEWIPHILTHEAKALETKMRDSLTNAFHPIYNDELMWAMQRGLTLPSGKELIEHWKPQAELLFVEMYKQWYPE